MKPSIVIHYDHGLGSTLYAKLAGIIQTISPSTEVVEANLAIEKGNTPMLSAYLYTSVPFWPDNTIFISIVGKGKPVAVFLPNGSCILSYDNGDASFTCHHFGFDSAYEIDTDTYGNDELCFARVAAHLVKGMNRSSIGKQLTKEEVTFFQMPQAHIEKGLAQGEIAMLLRTFGNITFTIGTDEFEDTGIVHGDVVHVTITRNDIVEYEADMSFQPSFGYVEEGAPLIFNGSSGYLDIGLNRRNFIEQCLPQIIDAEDPSEFKVTIQKI